jgi:glucoamylase
MPLLWAHSEYVKLHRSAADGRVFDLIEAAYERYVQGSGDRKKMEVWKSNRQVQAVPPGTLLRIQANSSFLLHWTSDDWQHSEDIRSQGTAIGIEFVDIPLPEQQKNPIQFTFLWLDEDRWERKDYTVKILEQDTEDRTSANSLRERKARRKRVTTVG